MTTLIEQRDEQYTATDIQVLEGMEAVRRRPGMYIGSTDQRGLHHLIIEIVDNAVDEFMAGFCSAIEITLNADGSVVGARRRQGHSDGQASDDGAFGR